jgi:hypothetical protein
MDKKYLGGRGTPYISLGEFSGKYFFDPIKREYVAKCEDVVNNPTHYNKHGVECIEAIKASMTDEEYKGYLKGNVLKYVWRYNYKGKPAEDLDKAHVYLGWLIKEVKGESP